MRHCNPHTSIFSTHITRKFALYYLAFTSSRRYKRAAQVFPRISLRFPCRFLSARKLITDSALNQRRCPGSCLRDDTRDSRISRRPRDAARSPSKPDDISLEVKSRARCAPPFPVRDTSRSRFCNLDSFPARVWSLEILLKIPADPRARPRKTRRSALQEY